MNDELHGQMFSHPCTKMTTNVVYNNTSKRQVGVDFATLHHRLQYHENLDSSEKISYGRSQSDAASILVNHATRTRRSLGGHRNAVFSSRRLKFFASDVPDICGSMGTRRPPGIRISCGSVNFPSPLQSAQAVQLDPRRSTLHSSPHGVQMGQCRPVSQLRHVGAPDGNLYKDGSAIRQGAGTEGIHAAENSDRQHKSLRSISALRQTSRGTDQQAVADEIEAEVVTGDAATFLCSISS